ncbi:MAG: molecular chaperone DnaJ [Patescibacteria group bacterium]|nr:molecular chaperone DnaJ [Patescibacteria group bacterium]
MSKDYYQILGIEKGASKDDVKKAFHKLAHKYHPDKKNGDEGKFKEVNEAYQVLGDDSKRQQYDTFGSAGSGGGMGGGAGNAGGWDFTNFSGGDASGSGFAFDLGDIFGDMFGGRRGGGQTKRGRDISVDIQISFADSVFGTERQVLINKIGVCDTCDGKGAEPGTELKTCSTCNGQGKIQESRRSFLGVINVARECEACRGSGKVPEKGCKACGGHGTLKKTEEIKIKIPAGLENGEMIRLSGRGEAITGGVAGDLYVRVHVDKHAIFRREGANLLMDLKVKFSDAILGAEQKLKTLDGDLNLKIPAGISSGEFLRVRNKGVHTGPNKRGDLLIKVIVSTPTRLSRQAKKLMEELKKEGL